MTPTLLFIIFLSLALLFGFLNGFHDSANIVATMISSRAISPTTALIIVGIAEFLGPFLLGSAVAKTIGADIAVAQAITISVVMAALISASVWNLLTWYFGIPSSSSHALFGGIIGAVIIGYGVDSLQQGGIFKISIALFSSPIIGFVLGTIVMKLTLWLAQGATPKANIFFKKIQIPTAVALALSHGGNDAQKTMGMIVMGLVALGYQSTFYMPVWVIAASAAAMAIGTATGGWRIIHTLGGKFYRIRPIHSFSSQFTSGIVIFSASIFGGPVSTTQIVSSAIVGVGAAERKSQVRWGVMSEILVAWVLTIPAAAVMGALVYLPIQRLLNI